MRGGRIDDPMAIDPPDPNACRASLALGGIYPESDSTTWGGLPPSSPILNPIIGSLIMATMILDLMI